MLKKLMFTLVAKFPFDVSLGMSPRDAGSLTIEDAIRWVESLIDFRDMQKSEKSESAVS